MYPEERELPERYRRLLDWYRQWAGESAPDGDPLLALYGTAQGMFPEGADEYVRQLREGWE